MCRDLILFNCPQDLPAQTEEKYVKTSVRRAEVEMLYNDSCHVKIPDFITIMT
jgi:hypothetical protein